MPQTTTCICFSPTYTTSSYLRYIAEGIGGTVNELDLTGPEFDAAPKHFGKDELVIFGAPVYGGRIPALARERFLKITGSGPAIIVTPYGNRAYEDALRELFDLVSGQGFTVAAAAAPIARHSLLSHHATDRPDIEDRAASMDFGRKIADKLASAPLEQLSPVQVEGNFPYKEVAAAPWRPLATDECNLCLRCVKSCPTSAIPEDDPKSTGEGCITCGRCLLVCPRKARIIPEPVFKMMRERIDPLCAGHKKSLWII